MGQYSDVLSTIEPLNHILLTIGLSSVTRSQGKLQYYWRCWKLILILCIVFIATACNVYIKFQFLMNLPIVNFNNSIQMFYILIFFQFVVDLYFFSVNRKDYLEYYLLYEYIDRILGVPNYAQMKRNNNRFCIFFIFIAASTILIDYTAWRIAYSWFLNIIYSIDYLYLVLRIIGSLYNEIMVQFTQVLFRLKVIGDCIEAFSYTNNSLQIGGLVAAQTKDRVDRLKIVCYSHCDVILWYRRCYLLLLEQCDFINSAYGFRILLNNVIFVLDMVMLINLMIRQIMGSSRSAVTSDSTSSASVLSTVIRIINSLCLLLFGISRCEQNYREIERTIRLIDDLIINKKTGLGKAYAVACYVPVGKDVPASDLPFQYDAVEKPEEHAVSESLLELKHLISTRPVQFKAMNFYRLDYSCFVSVISAIVTYTIILLQSLT